MGGKASRARTKARRQRERRAKKKNMQEMYQKWRDQGINQKSKRYIKGKNQLVKTKRHRISNCGNHACQKCNSISFAPFLKDGKPYRMPHWMFQKWMKRNG